MKQQTVALNALMARLKYGVGGLTEEVGSLAAGGMLWNVQRRSLTKVQMSNVLSAMENSEFSLSVKRFVQDLMERGEWDEFAHEFE